MALLSLQSVSKSHWRGPRELRVLRGASLEVAAGSLVSVYGPRGSGKTTLLEIAAGFQPPDGGRVEIDGVDLAALAPRELARLHRDRIAWVERKGPHNPELDVATYVALPLYRALGRRSAERRARAALAAHGAGNCADERWADLSDAARVRCAIAQAMVREPRLLVVDDPTAALGIVDRNQMCALLRAAAEDAGVAVLMAVPDMPSMLHAHEVRLLSRGRLLGPSACDRGEEAAVLDFPSGRRSA